MENIVIIIIILAAVGYGIYSTCKHFRGQGGCCGGGSYRPKKKKLSHVLYQKTFQVEGMHCEHCKNRVEEVVNDIKGVAGKVNLKNGEIVISYEEEVDDEKIQARIEQAGYKVVTDK